MKRGLHRMQRAVGGEALYGGDVRTVGFDREHGAALHRRSTDVHDTRAALARIAADVRAGEPEVFTDEVDEQGPALDLAFDRLSIDGQRHRWHRQTPRKRVEPSEEPGWPVARGSQSARALGEGQGVGGRGVDSHPVDASPTGRDNYSPAADSPLDGSKLASPPARATPDPEPLQPRCVGAGGLHTNARSGSGSHALRSIRVPRRRGAGRPSLLGR